MCGHVRLRRDTSMCEIPGSSLSVVGPRSGQERTPARGYGRLIRSERRSRTHPVLLQKIYEGAHLWQKQAGGRGLDGQRGGRPLIGLEHSLKPAVSEIMRNLPPPSGVSARLIALMGGTSYAQGPSHVRN